jgi:hypothetical protein
MALNGVPLSFAVWAGGPTPKPSHEVRYVPSLGSR